MVGGLTMYDRRSCRYVGLCCTRCRTEAIVAAAISNLLLHYSGGALEQILR